LYEKAVDHNERFANQNKGAMGDQVRGAVESAHSGNVMGVPGVTGPVLAKSEAGHSAAGTPGEAHHVSMPHNAAGIGQSPTTVHGQPVSHGATTHGPTQIAGTTHGIAGAPAPTSVPGSHAAPPAAGDVRLAQGGAVNAAADALSKAAAADMVNQLDYTKGIVPGSGTPTKDDQGNIQVADARGISPSGSSGSQFYSLPSAGATASGVSPVAGAVAGASQQGGTVPGTSPMGGTVPGTAPSGGTYVDNDSITVVNGTPSVQTPGQNVTGSSAGTVASAPAERTTAQSGGSILSQALGMGGSAADNAAGTPTNKLIADGLHARGMEHAERFASQNVGKMGDQVRSAIENPNSGNSIGVPGVSGPVLARQDAGSANVHEAQPLAPNQAAGSLPSQPGVAGQAPHSGTSGQPPIAGAPGQPMIAGNPPFSSGQQMIAGNQPTSSANPTFASPSVGHVGGNAADNIRLAQAGPLNPAADALNRAAAGDMVNQLDPTKGIVPDKGTVAGNDQTVGTSGATGGLSYALPAAGGTASGAAAMPGTRIDQDNNFTFVNGAPPVHSPAPTSTSGAPSGSMLTYNATPASGSETVSGSTPVSGSMPVSDSTPTYQGSTPASGSAPTYQGTTPVAGNTPTVNGAPTPGGTAPVQGNAGFFGSAPAGTNTSPSGTPLNQQIANGLYAKGQEHAERFGSQNMAAMTNQVQGAVENPHAQPINTGAQPARDTDNPPAQGGAPINSFSQPSGPVSMARDSHPAEGRAAAPPVDAQGKIAADGSTRVAADASSKAVADGAARVAAEAGKSAEQALSKPVFDALSKDAVQGMVNQLDPTKGIVPGVGSADARQDAHGPASLMPSAGNVSGSHATFVDHDTNVTLVNGVPSTHAAPTPPTQALGPAAAIPAVAPAVLDANRGVCVPPDASKFGTLSPNRDEALNMVRGNKQQSGKSGQGKSNTGAEAANASAKPGSKLSSALGRAAQTKQPPTSGKKGSKASAENAPPQSTAQARSVNDPMGAVATGNTLRRWKNKRKMTAAEREAMKKLGGMTIE
jgi:hypothetical protein